MHKSLVALAAGLTLVCSVAAQTLPKEKLNLGPWEHDIGYAQAIRVGDTLYVSGSVGTGPMPEAVAAAFGTVQTTLAKFGLDFHHVVKETAYTTDIEALKAAKDVRKRYYGDDFPAATWVQVARLFDPAHVVEVEVVAVFPPSGAAPAR